MTERQAFNRDDHFFSSPQLEDLLKDAISFFNRTPVYQLPPPEKFVGSGVYAIYYIGNFGLYEPISRRNQTSYSLPIYIGKAIPVGSRRGQGGKESTTLFNRLNEHARSINQTDNLHISDFYCRFMIITQEQGVLIQPIESAMIKLYHPLWNSCVDGFGNHDPGKGRYEQARSQWDTIHTGRTWVNRVKGTNINNELDKIEKKIQDYIIFLNTKNGDNV